MGRVKGCINKACVVNQKKVTLKKSDDYCSKCGDKLFYVCKKCYMQLSGDSVKYCERCLAVRQDQKSKRLKKAGAAGGIILGVGAGAAAIVKNGKKIIKFIAQLK